MFFLILITLLNAAANNKTFVLDDQYRWAPIPGMPMNIFDFLLAIGFITMLVRPRAHRFVTDRVHPAYKWILILFAGGALAGFLGTFFNDAEPREKANIARNFLAMPLSVILGYAFLNNPRSAGRFPYVHVIGGTISALMILMFFVGQSELNAAAGNVNLLRSVEYISSYAGTAAIFVIFTIMAKVRFLPLPLALGLAGFCIVGQFATLTRSEWVATTAGFGTLLLLLPQKTRWVSGAKIVVSVSLMFVALYAGVQMASRVTGWDFAGKVEKKVMSLLPRTGNESGDDQHKAWETRLPGAIRELEIWVEHPIIGAGFGYQAAEERKVGHIMGFYHNAWTATLAHAGPVGLAAMALTAFSCLVVGRRLVRDRFDLPSMSLGGLAAICGGFFIVYGLSTLSFNTLRGAIPLGLMCGMVLRCRAMQLTLARQYAGYLPEPQPNAEQWTPQFDESGGLIRPAF